MLQAVGLQDERPLRLEDCDCTLRFGLADGELVVQPVVAAAIEISNRPSAPRFTPAARYWPPNGKRSSRPDISRRPFTID